MSKQTFAQKLKKLSSQVQIKDDQKFKIKPLIIFGDPNIQFIEQNTQVVGGKSKVIKNQIESLKQSGTFLKQTYSLSSNQIGLNSNMFVIYKKLQNNIWFDIDKKISAKDFNVYINPEIQAVSELEEYAWEYCCSFPSIRCQVKRPTSVKVNYFNENFDQKTSVLEGFLARVRSVFIAKDIILCSGKFLMVKLMSQNNLLLKTNLIQFQLSIKTIQYKKEHQIRIILIIYYFPQYFEQNESNKIKDLNKGMNQNYWDPHQQQEEFEREIQFRQQIHQAIDEDDDDAQREQI